MMWWKFVLLITCVQLTWGGVIIPPNEIDWWQNSVIYEIFPLSFKDSDGDGSGDFGGIIQKLDYLVDIGVTAVWLTPFLESPLKSGGYDIKDYLNVQKVFGTMDDMKALIKAAHEKNLKIIMDFVPNHTSDEHIWFQNSVKNISEYADYYIWKDAKNQAEVLKNNSITPIPPTNWKLICSNEAEHNSAWIWNKERQQFYYAQFIDTIPDLNFRNKNVFEEMKNVLSFWLELGIDGIRIDALKHVYESVTLEDEPISDPQKPVDYFNLRHIYTADQNETYDLIKEWRSLLDDFRLNSGTTRIIMTESYSTRDILFKYYLSGVQIPTNFFLMDSPHRFTPEKYETELEKWITKMPKGETYNNVLQNHDWTRVPTKYGDELTDGLNALTLFLPGVAIVYYGGEIGMEDIPDKINFARSPMQWDNTKHAGFMSSNTNEPWVNVHPNYVTKNVQTEMNDPKSHLNFFKSVTRLRKTETLKRGGLSTYIFNETVFVLNRFLPGNENYTLVINMDSNSQHVRLSDQIVNLYGSNLSVVSSSEKFSIRNGDLISAESLTLNPYAAVILTDMTLLKTQTTESKTSSSIQLYMTFNILLLCLYITQICFLS